MAIVSKEFDLYAWRNNNINIVAVSQENNGKEIVFNLYTEATQSKLLNSNSKDYISHLYVNLPNNKSAYVIGTLDKTNSKVTFTLDSCVLPTCGRFNCFVSLICDDTIIKFAGMTLCVLDGSISDYVDNTSKTDSYDVLVSNVNYLMDKIDNVVSNFDIANGFEGKILSILGDSISTFSGYIPKSDGYNLTHRARYPQSNLLTDVADTWWHRLMTNLNMKLGINDSWAGSRVSNESTTNSGDVGPKAHMASITRITNLGANGTPDLILFYGGTNDLGANITLGKFDSTATHTAIDLKSETYSDFATAYKIAIQRLMYMYPKSKIVVLLPMVTSTYYSHGNLDKYLEIIKNICDYFGVYYIDLRRCGINWFNKEIYLPDGIHPNAKGMELMERHIRQQLLSVYSNDGIENIVYTVENNLKINTNSVKYIKGVSKGEPYNATITGQALKSVNITMGGYDITSTVYDSSSGRISIPNVTGNIIINEAEVVFHNITVNVTNGTYTGDTKIVEGSKATVTVSAGIGYKLPSDITVNGADYIYTNETGDIELSNATGNVTINVICEEYQAEIYDITTNVTNGTYIGATEIQEDSSAIVTIIPDEGYKLPKTITVTNAQYDYKNGVITLSNATGNVTINVICEVKLFAHTDLEYIKSNGVSYIDTGITYQANDRWEVETIHENTGHTEVVLGYGETGGKWIGTVGGYYGVGPTATTTISDTVKAKLIGVFTDKGVDLTAEANNQTSTAHRNITASNADYNYCLFAMVGNTLRTNYPYAGKIYSAKLIRNDEIIMNLIPVKKDSDNTITMFDTISKTYLAATGTFTGE